MKIGTSRFTRTLMVQGTSSSSGKSLLVTALCRIFARQGVHVAPFKAQNMSNNAAICPDGSEIGRAQAVQAIAAGIEPQADMNPILLKPEADSRCQVVLNGQVWRTFSAREYYRHKPQLWAAVTAALDRLRAHYELVIIEGAGSPVELNLKTGDLVNMAIARYAQSPVLLVGDIDRGGIFAQLLGTLWLLPPEERTLVRAMIINKFRGDLSLFAEGVRILEERGGIPVLGIVPYLDYVRIPDEDAVAIEEHKYLLDTDALHATLSPGEVDVVVIKLPHIANFDDFDALVDEPGVRVRYVSNLEALGLPHAIVLPGSKSTLSDLRWLRTRGLADAIREFAARGGAVVGICGGYQMLGQVIRDPLHTESSEEEIAGLSLLPVETDFAQDKVTHRVTACILEGPGWLAPLSGTTVHGYEIHKGRTRIITSSSSQLAERPWLCIVQRSNVPVEIFDGAISADGRIWGCYIHGLFNNAHLRWAWLASLGWQRKTGESLQSVQQNAFDALADAVEDALDMKKLYTILKDT
ncbi:MAG: cobyric acid synthase [Anaerolineae bacterium]